MKSDRKRLAAIAATLAVVLTVGVAVAFTRLGGGEERPRPSSAKAVEATASVLASESTGTLGTPPQLVEVPDVQGRPLADAELVMRLAGFSVERRADTTATPDADRHVTAQEPSPGTKLESGASIVLVHALEPVKAAAKPPAPANQYVVVLDPGHQRRSNMGVEPIGPGSSETKTKVTGGAQGVATRMPEYEFALSLANRVRQRLETRGVKVVMTRARHDVDVTNIERAQIGNKAKADLAVRLHADSNIDRSIRGISTLFPASNTWTKPIASRSQAAAQTVNAAVIASTAAPNRGTKARGDLTGFNWSTVPVILVEAGFLSNPAEDKSLASASYQDRLADGIVAGIMKYLQK